MKKLSFGLCACSLVEDGVAVVIAALSPLFARLRRSMGTSGICLPDAIGPTFARLPDHERRPINDLVEKQCSA